MSETVPPPAATPSRPGAPPLRERLVTVATGLFAAQGYDATSVQQIVQAHDGDVEVASADTRTQFEVRLPRQGRERRLAGQPAGA